MMVPLALKHENSIEFFCPATAGVRLAISPASGQ
jgi:hypothetical protein